MRGAAWITRSNSAPTTSILGFTNRSDWCWCKVHHDHNQVHFRKIVHWNFHDDKISWHFTSVVPSLCWHLHRSRAERSGERPLKNGRSVERDATERAWATERQIGPLRSHALCLISRLNLNKAVGDGRPLAQPRTNAARCATQTVHSCDKRECTM